MQLKNTLTRYGVVAQLFHWVIVALILRISDHARRPVPDLRLPSPDEDTQVVRMR